MAKDSGIEVGGRAALRAAFACVRPCASGATSIEYGLMAAMLAIAMITTFTLFGSSVGRMYEQIGTTVTTKMSEGW